MRVREQDSEQRRLYTCNRSVPSPEQYAEIVAIERDWVVRRAAEAEQEAPRFGSHADLIGALRELLREEETAGPSESERFIAEEATLDQFRTVVAEFAVDGLVESQSHLGIIPRLPAKARMAVFRVLIDEFGGGNDEQEHSRLYRELVTELGMPTELQHYIDRAGDESFAYVNLFHWLASRAPAPEYFLGAYAYFESSVLYGFKCYAAASERLGIVNRSYYDEHLYIDNFHSQQMRTAIGALAEERALDAAKVWAGIQLTSAQVVATTDAAVARARRVGSS